MDIKNRWTEPAHFCFGLEPQMHQRVGELLKSDKTATTVYLSATYGEKGITSFEVELQPTETAKWPVNLPCQADVDRHREGLPA